MTEETTLDEQAFLRSLREQEKKIDKLRKSNISLSTQLIREQRENTKLRDRLYFLTRGRPMVWDIYTEEER